MCFLRKSGTFQVDIADFSEILTICRYPNYSIFLLLTNFYTKIQNFEILSWIYIYVIFTTLPASAMLMVNKNVIR